MVTYSIFKAIDKTGQGPRTLMFMPLLIPKMLHQIWVGEKKIPEKFKSYAVTWQKYFPTWEYRLWDERTLASLEGLDHVLLGQCPLPAEKADYLRFFLLERFGGMYVDTDFECLRNFEPLLENHTFFLSEEHPGCRYYTNSLVGSVPGHPVSQMLLAAFPDRIRRYSHLGANWKMGPDFVTSEILRSSLCDRVHVFPSHHFFPYSWDEDLPPGKTLAQAYPDAYAAHHWSRSWMSWGYRLKLKGYSALKVAGLLSRRNRRFPEEGAWLMRSRLGRHLGRVIDAL